MTARDKLQLRMTRRPREFLGVAHRNDLVVLAMQYENRASVHAEHRERIEWIEHDKFGKPEAASKRAHAGERSLEHKSRNWSLACKDRGRAASQ